MSAARSLLERLKAEIEATGPISVAEYMLRCLHDPRSGYYSMRPALGAEGDFITAPLVSQMFGELIGLWMVETWKRMGSPARVSLVELGPGDGTLIHDALRAARLVPAFLAACDLTLIEASKPLIERQKMRLADAPLAAVWADRLAEVAGDGPVILVANEFLDCLPARQFIRGESGWSERMVGLDEAGDLCFGLRPAPAPQGASTDAKMGVVWEISAAQQALGAELGALVAERGGAALMIDYGRDTPGTGDTFQALSEHRKIDPLAAPGCSDLTIWADFPAVLNAAREVGAAVTGILPQGEFLRRLGIEQRAAALARSRPEAAPVIARQLARLVEPDQMGSLFKVCAIHAPGLIPPGFEELT